MSGSHGSPSSRALSRPHACDQDLSGRAEHRAEPMRKAPGAAPSAAGDQEVAAPDGTLAEELPPPIAEVSRVNVKDAAGQFLANKRIAVTGVSRTPKGHGSNLVYQRLRERGYEVFAVNPNAQEVEGDRCFRDLKSIPGGVKAVVIGTRPEIAEDTMRECADLGIKQVWMHRGPGAGSVSDAATSYGRQHDITVIDGGCPLMFGPTGDFGHKMMRFMLSGHVPKQV